MNRTYLIFLLPLFSTLGLAQKSLSEIDSAYLQKNYDRIYDVYQHYAFVDFPGGGMGLIDFKKGKEIYKCNNCDIASGLFSANGLMEFAYPESMFIDTCGNKYYYEIKKTILPYKDENGKFGFEHYHYSKEYSMYKYMDRFSAKYDTIYPLFLRRNGVGLFSSGAFIVEIGKKIGFVDSLGKEFTSIYYDFIDPLDLNIQFYKDSAYVMIQVDGKKGLLNPFGKEIIPPVFYTIGIISEDLVAVQQTENWKFGYWDLAGNVVIDSLLPYYDVSPFHEGLARVEVRFISVETGLEIINYGYINRSGKEIIPAKFISADDFRNGKARVTDINGKTYYISKNGEKISR